MSPAPEGICTVSQNVPSGLTVSIDRAITSKIWEVLSYFEYFGETGPCHPGAIAVVIILVPYHVVKSLQLIWRLGTRRWNLRVPNLQMSCSDSKGTRIVVPVMTTRVTCPSGLHWTYCNEVSVKAVGPQTHRRIFLPSPGTAMDPSSSSLRTLPLGPAHLEEGLDNTWVTERL